MSTSLSVVKLSLLCAAFSFFTKSSRAADHDVTSYVTLVSAIGAANDGDVIVFKAHIVVNATISFSKSLTFKGNNYTITVPVTGLTDAGIYNLSPSSFNVFTISGAKTIVFNNLTIKGGSTTASGAAVRIGTGTTVKFNYCTISNGSCTVGGGGIFNQGNCYLFRTLLTRNVARYGGGMLNQAGRVYVEYSTINENRTLTVDGGGGIETQQNGFLYVNNTSFSNNQSGAGGAINNYGSQTIVCNSSFTGNVVFNTAPLRGGAIYQDSRGIGTNTLTVVNCLFAYNYYAPSGAYAASSYTIDDIRAVAGTVSMYYSTYMNNSASAGTFSYVIGNNAITRAANGSDNDLFTGGSLTTPFDGSGVVQGTGQIFQPLLVNINNQRVPTLRTGSYALTRGCVAGFTNGSGTPVIGYRNMTTSTWVNLVGSGASGYSIPDDLTSFTRSATPAVGAVERVVDNYVMVKINASTLGTVDGGSIYGEVYPSGTAVTMTALPIAGYALNNWTYNLGGSGTVSGNPLTITPTTNTTLTPNFLSSTNYTITYIGNGNTGGTPPAIASYSSSVDGTVAANTGSLVKEGFTFDGWNTSIFGSGSSYAAGAAYTSRTNMVLYANWISLGTTLPVTLVDFTATVKENRSVLLKWETAAESNNEYFEVQRSQSGVHWETVGIVQAAGHNTGNHQSYSLSDTRPYEGQNLYRLKQVDKDGRERFFKTVKVQLSRSATIALSIYPNPVTDKLTLKAAAIEAKTIRVYTQAGQDMTALCKLTKKSEEEYVISLEQLPAGIYLVQTNTGNSQFIKTKN